MPPNDHFQNLTKICCHCGRKRGLRDSAKYSEDIKSLLIPDYNYQDSIFPTVICDTCRLYVIEKKKDPESTKSKLPPPLKYEELFPRRSSRSKGLFDPKPGVKCDCGLCEIARLTLGYPDYHKQHSRHVGRAPLPPPLPPSPILVCSKCFSPYGPGKKHVCSKSTLQDNLVMRVRQKSVNTREKVVSKSLKSIANDQEVSTRGGRVQLTTCGPNKLSVIVGKRKNEDREKPKVSLEFMTQLQNTLSCSDLDTLKIGRCLRVFLGRNNMEPGLKAALTSRNRSLQDLFHIEQIEFETKDEEPVTKPAVVADVPALITLLLQERALDPSHHQLHLGLDGGQDVLKVCLLVCQAVGDEPQEKRAGDFKLTSSKKIMIIAAAQGVDENYSNVKALLEKLDLESIGEHPFAVDIKMMLILCGKQSASSRHSCPYCEGSGDFSKNYDLYTLGSLKTYLANFQAAGSVKRKAKDYSNVTRPALITGSDSDLTLELLNFPSLHVLTGVTGKIVTEMVKSITGGDLFISTFMKENGIKWCDYRPETFEGNQARKFVKLGKKLEEEARKIKRISSAVRAIQFAKTLKYFNNVVVACFGQELDEENFREKISAFEGQYRMLDISVTPKVHLVFSHIADFLELKDEVSGLGKWTEQAMESAHHEFKNEWNLKRLDVTHPKFGENFLQTVVRFNSKRV